MLADDFGFLVTLEAPRPGIPAANNPGGVQHVDRVVSDRLNQHAVTAVCRLSGLKSVLILQSHSGGSNENLA